MAEYQFLEREVGDMGAMNPEQMDQSAEDAVLDAYYAWLDDPDAFHEDQCDGFKAGAAWAKAEKRMRIVALVQEERDILHRKLGGEALDWAEAFGRLADRLAGEA